MTSPVRARRLSMSTVTGGAAATPLLILFGFNAVDELDRSAFNVLVPEIQDHFDLDIQGILTVIAVVGVFSFLLQPIIGFLGDRGSRVKIAAAGASAWGVFSVLTGLSPVLWVLVAARIGSSLGRLVNDPTHNSLLADYYEPDHRTKVYGFHRAANSTGQVLGPLAGGFLALWFGWRAPFIVFGIPTVILILIAVTRLREPVRGMHERTAMGATAEVAATEETSPSMAESWRICNQVHTLRRIWAALPFFAAAVIGLGALTNIFYEDVFGLNEAERGTIAAFAEPFQIIGIIVGIPLATRLFRRRPGLVLNFLAVAGTLSATFLCAFALSPNLPTAITFNILASSVIGVVTPGIYAVLSLAIPPRARAMGFSIGSLYIVPGFVILVVIGGMADELGIRAALLILLPVFLAGAFILASAGRFVEDDIIKVRTSALAQAEVRAKRERGEVKLLLVKDLDVAYDDVQVLFGVDFEVDEGEIVALLGTNGAGKSTLLRAISGLTEASAGAVVFDGRDMTYAPPQEIAARGVVQVPGGKGVFPGLTVEENMKIAGWLYRHDPDYVRAATDDVLGYFPVLRERWEQPAGNLSGGEQQMLTLGQAFIARPRLLMIDELSLGLAPLIVEQLLDIVKAIRERGTTIILVEQSVNVALNIAEIAYFMEKGEIRFHGPTEELLDRPDILRAVFLEGAGSVTGDEHEEAATDVAGHEAEEAVETRPVTPAVARRAQYDGHAAILEVRGITKSFGGINALTDVSFDLVDGEILGIIGPNGAGKTTLFDVISGFLVPDAGRILLAGDDITPTSPDVRSLAGLGRSFQDARLYPALTVAETIALALEREVEVRDPVATALGMPSVTRSEQRISQKVDDLIDLMGLAAFADKFVSELSTGSRRIVDISCIVAQQPRVILFDEPSSGIAQKETEALGPLLKGIRDNTDASLVVIEHDMPLVTSTSDRILALDLGTVVTDGPPDEVVHHPKVVASYLGTSDEVIARSGTAAVRQPSNASRSR